MLGRPMLRSASLAALLLFGGGCSLFNPLRLEPIATSVQKPSNVAVYVAVTNRGQPIDNLQADSFRIYENELLLSADDTGQRILPQEVAAYHQTLLLVDVSGESSSREPLSRAVAGFVEGVRGTQTVSVFAFDGSGKLRSLGEFNKSAERAPVDLRALAQLGASDGSRNLNGALRSGLAELDARLARQSKPVRVGTLVVFTRGADLAGRVSQSDANQAVQDSPHEVLAVGLAEHGATLSNIGKSGVIEAQDADSLGIAFEQAASKTRSLYENHYLIAYCSPARGGTRRLKVEVRFRDEEGDDYVASFSKDFDATGFGPDCRADAPPRFVAQASASDPKPRPVSRVGAERVVPPPDEPGYAP